MTRKLLTFAFALIMSTIIASAKNIQKVVFSVPQMVCENCEAKVKKNIKNLKGLKALETNVPQHTVTISYDADVTSVEKIQAAFKKFNYTATVKGGNAIIKPAASCCQSQKQASCCEGQKKSDCCK